MKPLNSGYILGMGCVLQEAELGHTGYPLLGAERVCFSEVIHVNKQTDAQDLLLPHAHAQVIK